LKRIGRLWNDIRYSLWFIPSVILAVATALAIAAIELDSTISADTLAKWPKLFGASADGARIVLQVVSSAMITVAGLTFSITILILSLAGTQYTPRLIRTFMGSRPTQAVLGIFLGIFVYCVIVLRSVRGGEENFVPSVAVTLAIGLALLGVGVLIYFIHHIASSIQASSVISAISNETIHAIDDIYPDPFQTEPENNVQLLFPEKTEHQWYPVPSSHTGYIQNVNDGTLLACASKHRIIIRLELEIGEFVACGLPVALVTVPPKSDWIDDINRAISVGHYRTVEQDIGVGIRQLVDIALKAMSPAVNDTTTAIMCIDFLSAILIKLADRKITEGALYEKGELRVILKGASFKEFMRNAFELIRENAKDNVAVYASMLRALEHLACRTTGSSRKNNIKDQIFLVLEYARRNIEHPDQRERIRERGSQAMKACQL
jgi:uncharacterized membrane protein